MRPCIDLHRLTVDGDLHRHERPLPSSRVRPSPTPPPCSLRWHYPDQVRGVPGRTRFSGILPPRRTLQVYTGSQLKTLRRARDMVSAPRRSPSPRPGSPATRGHPAGLPRYVARITRRMILALRVFGRSRVNRTFSGLSALPMSLRHALAELAPQRLPTARDPGCSTTKHTTASPFTSCGTPIDAGLGDGRMADQDRLDLGRAEALARDLQRVVGAALDVPEAVVVDVRPVAVHPHVGPARPVRLLVALGVAPEALRHAGPGPRDDELAHLPAHRACRRRRSTRRPCRGRARERARLDRRDRESSPGCRPEISVPPV